MGNQGKLLKRLSNRTLFAMHPVGMAACVAERFTVVRDFACICALCSRFSALLFLPFGMPDDASAIRFM